MAQKTEGDEKNPRFQTLYFRPFFIAGIAINLLGMLLTLGVFGESFFGYNSQNTGGWLFTIGILAVAIGYTRAQYKKKELEKSS